MDDYGPLVRNACSLLWVEVGAEQQRGRQQLRGLPREEQGSANSSSQDNGCK